MQLLLCLFLLLAPVDDHKFYVSLTDMAYNETSHRIEISSKYFIDDLELAIGLEDGKHITMPMDRNLLPILSNYMYTHLQISIDERNCPFELLGYEIEEDVVWVYMESEELSNFTDVAIRASQLCNEFEAQQNIVHFNKGGEIQSLFLRKDQDEGMLEFH